MVEKRVFSNKKACHFNKGLNSKHPCESSASKDPKNKETAEDQKKEKGPKNSNEKAWWQSKEKAKKQYSRCFPCVSIYGGMTIGSGI